MHSIPVTVATIVPARQIIGIGFGAATALLAIKLFLHLLLTTTLRFFFGFRISIW